MGLPIYSIIAAVNIHFTNLISGVENFPTGSFNSNLFHPRLSVISIVGRETAFSLRNGISFERTVFVFSHTGGIISSPLSQALLPL